MKNTMMFVGWNRPIAGREHVAVELFNSSLSYFNRLKNEGQIENFEPVLLTPHGGDLNGFFMLRGDEDKLNRIRYSEEWLNLTTQINMNVMGFGVTTGWWGEGVKDMMTRYAKYVTK